MGEVFEGVHERKAEGLFMKMDVGRQKQAAAEEAERLGERREL